MENKELLGKIYRFGIITDMEGNIMHPSINIEGVEVAKATLADWIWQGCKYMEDEIESLSSDDKERRWYLKRTMTDALTIHYKLLGKNDEEITKSIEDWFNE